MVLDVTSTVPVLDDGIGNLWWREFASCLLAALPSSDS